MWKRSPISGSYEHEIDKQGGMENKNKALESENCENIDTLYMNKNIYEYI